MSCLQIDRELDADTPNAGNHHFEKMVSGMYLGEVARRAILKLAVRPSPLIPHCMLCQKLMFANPPNFHVQIHGSHPASLYLQATAQVVACRSCLRRYARSRSSHATCELPKQQRRNTLQTALHRTSLIPVVPYLTNTCAGRGRAVWARGPPAAAGTLGADDASACQNRRGCQLAPVQHSSGAVRDTGVASLALHPHSLPPGEYTISAPILPSR